MKRRQFSAMLAGATVSLASLSGVSSAEADSSAQTTEPLEIENVSVSSGGLTTSIGRVSLSYDEAGRTTTFRVRDWTMSGGVRTLSVGRKQVTVEEMAPETYAEVREAMVAGFESQSVSTLLSGLADAGIDRSSPVRVSLRSVALGDRAIADRVTAAGTVGGAVPEGTRELVRDGLSLEGIAGLGASEWTNLTVQRGDTTVAADDVTMELQGTTFAVSSPSGTIETPGRSLRFEGMTLNVFPPDPIPAEHVQFASRVRQLGAQGKLTLSAVQSAAADSGVTVSNTVDALRRAPFELRFADVTEGGQSVVSDFETTGQLGELFQTLPVIEDVDADEGEFPKEAVVSTPGTDQLFEYVFEVTGDLVYLEPDEDGPPAGEEVTELDDGVRVEGAVSTGDDRFAFSGELVEVDVPSEVQIEIRQR